MSTTTMRPRPLTVLPLVELGGDYWTDRGTYLARLHDAHGPVVRALLGRAEVVFLLGPEANRLVLQSHRRSFMHREAWDWTFGRRADPPNLLTMDDPPHALHRRALHPAFAARHIADDGPAIVRAIDRRLATWTARGIVDVYEEARVITLDVVADAVLGLRAPADLALCRAVHLHGAGRRAGDLDALLLREVRDRRARAGGHLDAARDGLDLLARARDEQGRPLNDAQILAHAGVLLVAGHETSASLAAWMLYLLARHPAYARRVRDEARQGGGDAAPCPAAGPRARPVLDRFLSEAERLYPPISVVPRVVAAEVVVAGYAIPAGTRVLLSPAASHALPHVWDSPEVFDPDRFAPPREEHKCTPYALVGFGGGPRACIGRALARLELAVLATRVLTRYDLDVDPDQRVVQRPGVTSRPLRGIRLHVAPRPAHDPERPTADVPATWRDEL